MIPLMTDQEVRLECLRMVAALTPLIGTRKWVENAATIHLWVTCGRLDSERCEGTQHRYQVSTCGQELCHRLGNP